MLKFAVPLSALAGIFVGALNPAASAADYPTRPIQLIVGFSAGGGVDLAARMVVTASGPESCHRESDRHGRKSCRASGDQFPARRPYSFVRGSKQRHRRV